MPGDWKELMWWEVQRGFRCSELYGLWVKITTVKKEKKKGKINHFLMKFPHCRKRILLARCPTSLG